MIIPKLALHVANTRGQERSQVQSGRGNSTANKAQKRRRKHSPEKKTSLQNEGGKEQDSIILVFMRSNRTTFITTAQLFRTSRTMAIEWYAYLQDICSHHLVENLFEIGGEGQKLQIDESLVSKRKATDGG